MRRIVLSFFASLLLLGASSGTFRAGAQGASLVHDVQSFINDMMNHFEEADQWITENYNAADELFHIEEMKGWMNKYFGDGSNWQIILKKARTTRDLAQLLQAVNYSTESYLTYARYISEHMSDLDPSVTASMMRRTSDLYYRVKMCYETAVDLLSDPNPNYNDKTKGTQELVNDAINAANDMNDDLDSMLNRYQMSKGTVVALGILDGLDESNIHQLVKGMGGSGSRYGSMISAMYGVNVEEPSLAEVREGSVSTKEVLGEDATAMSSGVKNAFKVVSILLALLMSGMLIIVLIKWNRGEYGAGDYGERGFLMVFVAIIVVSLVLSLLTGYIGFGL